MFVGRSGKYGRKICSVGASILSWTGGSGVVVRVNTETREWRQGRNRIFTVGIDVDVKEEPSGEQTTRTRKEMG